jgi:hypothetical protein
VGRLFYLGGGWEHHASGSLAKRRRVWEALRRLFKLVSNYEIIAILEYLKHDRDGEFHGLQRFQAECSGSLKFTNFVSPMKLGFHQNEFFFS